MEYKAVIRTTLSTLITSYFGVLWGLTEVKIHRKKLETVSAKNSLKLVNALLEVSQFLKNGVSYTK